MAKAPEKNELRIEDVKSREDFSSLDDVVTQINDSFGTPVFFLWRDRQLVIDGFDGWLFADFNWWAPDNAGNSGWLPITERFDNPDDLFDLPFLDGKSLRERFAECRFFVE